MRAVVMVLALLGGVAEAQGLREGDVVLSPDRLAQDVVGHTHTFFDGGQSFFSVTDSYTYTYPDGGVAYGRYELADGGQVCTFFTHGVERCDTYVQAGARMVLITEAGERFPIRESR